MPYQISWMVQQRLMHIELFGNMTLDELRAVAQESIAYTQAGIAPVHAVIDQSRVERVPISLSTLVNSMTIGVQPNSGVSVLVGGSRFTRYITQMLYQLVRLDMRQAEDIDQAIAVLQRLDETLPTAMGVAQPER